MRFRAHVEAPEPLRGLEVPPEAAATMGVLRVVPRVGPPALVMFRARRAAAACRRTFGGRGSDRCGRARAAARPFGRVRRSPARPPWNDRSVRPT